jgi:hypothetical protein
MGLNAVPYLLYHRRGESDGLPSAGQLVWVGVIGRAKAALAQRRMPSLFSTLSTVNP